MSEHPGRYVIMGVSGCGKTTVGTALARALGVPFVEGDAFHPPGNVDKMSAGVPLTDADRGPWLQALADELRSARNRKAGLVMSCSALRRAYRDVLRAGDPGVRFVFLDGESELIGRRLAGRRGHYMPPILLDSQLATLERPAPDEEAWTHDVAAPADMIVADLLQRVTT
jgi:gluconokinase